MVDPRRPGSSARRRSRLLPAQAHGRSRSRSRALGSRRVSRIGSPLHGSRGVSGARKRSSQSTALLNALKEELFSLESEKISGTISAEEYAKQKAALEIVLARALTRK